MKAQSSQLPFSYLSSLFQFLLFSPPLQIRQFTLLRQFIDAAFQFSRGISKVIARVYRFKSINKLFTLIKQPLLHSLAVKFLPLSEVSSRDISIALLLENALPSTPRRSRNTRSLTASPPRVALLSRSAAATPCHGRTAAFGGWDVRQTATLSVRAGLSELLGEGRAFAQFRTFPVDDVDSAD